MITHIHGKLVEKTPTYVVIDCNGIGYKIKISLQTFDTVINQSQNTAYTKNGTLGVKVWICTS